MTEDEKRQEASDLLVSMVEQLFRSVDAADVVEVLGWADEDDRRDIAQLLDSATVTVEVGWDD